MNKKASLSTKKAEPKSKSEKKRNNSSRKNKKKHKQAEESLTEDVHVLGDEPVSNPDAKVYFVCMFKQIQGSSKSEAKIAITQHPIKLLEEINAHPDLKAGVLPTLSSGTTHQDGATKQFISRKRFAKKKIVHSHDDASSDAEGSDNESTSENSHDASSKTAKDKASAHLKDRSNNLFWNIEMIFGQFTRDNALEFAQRWDQQSRGIRSRRKRGLEVFYEKTKSDDQLTCYDKAIIPIVPTLGEWLTKVQLHEYILPPNYMHKLNQVLQDVIANERPDLLHKHQSVTTLNTVTSNLTATQKDLHTLDYSLSSCTIVVPKSSPKSGHIHKPVELAV
jgi:hypothetical protein